MNIETACYYTFSTIAQTLAGSFGFLVAVALYRIQALEGHIGLLSEGATLAARNERQNDARRMRQLGQWRQLVELIEQNPMQGQETGSRLMPEEYVVILRDSLDRIDRIKKNLYTSLVAVAHVIGLCILFLGLTPILVARPIDGAVILFLMIGLTICCLAMFFPLMSELTGYRPLWLSRPRLRGGKVVSEKGTP